MHANIHVKQFLPVFSFTSLELWRILGLRGILLCSNSNGEENALKTCMIVCESNINIKIYKLAFKVK